MAEEEKYPLPTDKERMFLISSGGQEITQSVTD